MRNLKKTLCLLLAFVMVIGCMVTVSAAEFTDQDEIQNEEAAAVLSALGALQGRTNGEYDPQGILTRAEGATIIARLLLGVDTADNLTVGTAPFSDVPADHWAAGYISYCVSEGIIAGVGNNKFKPNDTLTIPQFAKMLLCALGYDADIEGFGTAAWQLNITALAVKIGMFKGVAGSYAAECTRETAAQMALNTLSSNMVYYPSGSIKVESGDTTITVGASAATYVANNATNETIADDNYMQFAESYFPKLKLVTENVVSNYGRPASYEWVLNGETVYTDTGSANLLLSTEGILYTNSLYSLIGKTAYRYLDNDESTLEVYVDGVGGQVDVNTDYKDLAPNSYPTYDGVQAYIEPDSDDNYYVWGSYSGVLTEVYMDDDYNVTIVQINTYLAQAADDYDDYNEELKIEVYDNYDGTTTSVTLEVAAGYDVEDYLADDWMLVTYDDNVVATVKPAFVVTGTVDAYVHDSAIMVNGKAYYYNDILDPTFVNNTLSIGSEIALILDEYDYIIGLDDVTTTAQYVYINDVAKSGTLSNSGIVAAAYFPDGTYAEIGVKSGVTVPTTGSFDGGWYSYTVNSAGKYILTAVTGKQDSGANVGTVNGELTLVGDNVDDYALTSATKFVVVDSDGDIATYTGYANVPTINKSNSATVSIDVIGNTYGYATYVFIDAGTATVQGSTSDDYIIVYRDYCATGVDSDSVQYYAYYYNLYNGEKAYVYSTMDLDVGLYTNLTTDEYGYLADADKVTTGESVQAFNANISYADGVVTIGGKSFALTDDCEVVVTKSSTVYEYTLARAAKFINNNNYSGTAYLIYDDNGCVTNIYFIIGHTLP